MRTTTRFGHRRETVASRTQSMASRLRQAFLKGQQVNAAAEIRGEGAHQAMAGRVDHSFDAEVRIGARFGTAGQDERRAAGEEPIELVEGRDQGQSRQQQAGRQNQEAGAGREGAAGGASRAGAARRGSRGFGEHGGLLVGPALGKIQIELESLLAGHTIPCHAVPPERGRWPARRCPRPG